MTNVIGVIRTLAYTQQRGDNHDDIHERHKDGSINRIYFPIVIYSNLKLTQSK